MEPIPLSEIVPGHRLWEVLLEYAALDAKGAVELYLKWKKEDSNVLQIRGDSLDESQ